MFDVRYSFLSDRSHNVPNLMRDGTYSTREAAEERVDGLKRAYGDDIIVGVHEVSEAEKRSRNLDQARNRAASFIRYEVDHYSQAGFTDEEWFLPYAEVHYPFLKVVDDRTMVSFYENENKLIADTRTEMRLGRYLRRFNKDLRDEEVERLVAAADVKVRGPALTITQDADEIEEVYVNGPNSCMAHPARCFNGHIHPVRVYAGPDLGVAYIGESDDASGRAIVWPEKKVYGGVYGDVSRMKLLLEREGYVKGSFRGARLRRIENENGPGLIAPYCDVSTWASDDGDWLVLGGGDICLNNTDGTCDSNMEECEECGCEYNPEDEGGYVRTGRYDDVRVCDSCWSDAVDCHEIGDRVMERAATRVVSSDGDMVWVSDWNLGDYVECEGRDELVHIDMTMTTDDGDVYHVDDAPEADEDDDGDDVPAATVAEAEEAGQTPLALEVAEGSDRYVLLHRYALDNGPHGMEWSPCVIGDSRSQSDIGARGTWDEARAKRDELKALNPDFFYAVVHTMGVEGTGRDTRPLPATAGNLDILRRHYVATNPRFADDVREAHRSASLATAAATVAA